MRPARGWSAAHAAGARSSPPARAPHRGPWLLFLHADTVLAPGWAGAARRHIEGGPERAGYFRLAFDSPHPMARRDRLLGQPARARFRLPYGDQGLLIARALYDRIGGYPEIPLMEDVAIARRLGRRLVPLDARGRHLGRALCAPGLGPARRPQPFDAGALVRRRQPRAPRRALSPLMRPTLVDLRQGAAAGPRRRPGWRAASARLRRPGGSAISRPRLIARLARDRRWRTVLAVTPDAEGLRSRVWPGQIPRAPQGGGDLGRRMARFLRREPGTRIAPGPVAVVGADLPELRAGHVARRSACCGATTRCWARRPMAAIG